MTEIKITPLGGLGQTGALNCMLYESEHSAVIVDCGAGFVDEQYPGVNILVPNFEVLERVRDKLQAVLLTHGHEDHVGALPYLLKNFALPVYATPFTRGIVQNKLIEFGLHKIQVHDLALNQTFSIGDFTIEPVYINHSIMDVVALYLKAQGRTIFHCTDFKIDYDHPEDMIIDLKRFKEIGKAGLDLLLLDSTNALVEGATASENSVRTGLLKVFQSVKGRLMACLFSSNTYRLQSLLTCARKTNRKVALTGRSTKEYFRIAAALDRLDLRGIELYDVEEITKFPDEQILVIVTGSQAEPRSVLSRISKNMFRPFKIKAGDTLLMSSRMIPGNEGRILHMLNQLSLRGAEIITENTFDPVHVSGHAMVDELKEVLKLLKPGNLIPIHGEFRHLKELAKIAELEGMNKKGIHLQVDGDTVTLSDFGIALTDQNPVEPNCVSENAAHFITHEAVKRRRKLAYNGLVIVSLVISTSRKEIVAPLQIFSEGIFGGSLEVRIMTELSKALERFVLDEDWKMDSLKKDIKTAALRFFKSRYEIRPEVLVLMNELS